ncbi:MAG: hypothetical protein JXB49_06315 [Bacteroidales bacterium]|nr:hypothetical protein [Bacteroidales bacterium]
MKTTLGVKLGMEVVMKTVKKAIVTKVYVTFKLRMFLSISLIVAAVTGFQLDAPLTWDN